MEGTERIMGRLRDLYRQYGYIQYKMSKFEPYDLYGRNKNFLVSERILTFTDTDGRLMALKPDVTLSIIKNAKTGAGMQKVYYNENVYRVSSSTHGFREIMQAGLECLGDIDLAAMGEVLLLAARSLALVHEGYLLDVSHLGFVAGLLDAANVAEEDRQPLLARMGEKNISALTARCREMGLDESVSQDLIRLTELYGPSAEVVPVLLEMVRNDRMAEALKELTGVCVLLEGCEEHLRMDFSIVNDMRYYNGFIFRGYLPGLPSGVLAGGRYDNLLHKMDRQEGAIGFAVYLDMLERLEQKEEHFDADVLLLYREDTPAAAVLQAAEAYRQQGKSVRADRQVPEGLTFRTIQEVR